MSRDVERSPAHTLVPFLTCLPARCGIAQVRRLCSERDGLRDALERRHTEMLQLQGQVALLQSHATEAESWLMTP